MMSATPFLRGALLVGLLALSAPAAAAQSAADDLGGLVIHCYGRLAEVLLCDDQSRCVGLDSTGKRRSGLPHAHYIALGDHDDLNPDDPESDPGAIDSGRAEKGTPLTHEIEISPRGKHYRFIVAGGRGDAQYFVGFVEFVWYFTDFDVRQTLPAAPIAAGERRIYDVRLEQTKERRLVVELQKARKGGTAR